MSEAKYMVGQKTIPNKICGYTYCIRNNNGNFYHMYRLDREQEGFPVIK